MENKNNLQMITKYLGIAALVLVVVISVWYFIAGIATDIWYDWSYDYQLAFYQSITKGQFLNWVAENDLFNNFDGYNSSYYDLYDFETDMEYALEEFYGNTISHNDLFFRVLMFLNVGMLIAYTVVSQFNTKSLRNQAASMLSDDYKTPKRHIALIVFYWISVVQLTIAALLCFILGSNAFDSYASVPNIDISCSDSFYGAGGSFYDVFERLDSGDIFIENITYEYVMRHEYYLPSVIIVFLWIPLTLAYFYSKLAEGIQYKSITNYLIEHGGVTSTSGLDQREIAYNKYSKMTLVKLMAEASKIYDEESLEGYKKQDLIELLVDQAAPEQGEGKTKSASKTTTSNSKAKVADESTKNTLKTKKQLKEEVVNDGAKIANIKQLLAVVFTIAASAIGLWMIFAWLIWPTGNNLSGQWNHEMRHEYLTMIGWILMIIGMASMFIATLVISITSFNEDRFINNKFKLGIMNIVNAVLTIYIILTDLTSEIAAPLMSIIPLPVLTIWIVFGLFVAASVMMFLSKAEKFSQLTDEEIVE